MKTAQKQLKRTVRKRRIRARVSGTATKPRLCVYRSNSHIYAQIVDDKANKTLVSAQDLGDAKGAKMARAEAVGKAIAEKAKEKNITKVVFDRGGFIYTGRVKSLAEAARKAGLVF